jgi:probable rRNA maturation factor
VTVKVEVRNRSRAALDRAAAADLLAAALAAEGVTEGEVGLVVVGRREMAELNASHRGKAEPTDVLSFPLDGTDPLPDGLPRQVGDVVVCPAVARAEGTPLAHLLVHGALHLVGYDHETDDGEMLVRQRQILEEVGARAPDPA